MATLLVLLLFLFATDAFAGGKEQVPASDASTRPKGVSPQLSPLYQERAEFECLDGKKKIPFEQVNDDYCDCADGSDEPGTSACKNGRFYCANLGYRPVTLPSSRVNDFICDCCDGSDEWDSGTECPNVCEPMGAKAREEAKQRAEINQAGFAKRKELAAEGAKMLEQKRSELEKKKQELEQLEALKKGAEERKNEAETQENEAKSKQDAEWAEKRAAKRKTEAEEMFRRMDTDGDGTVRSEEMKQYAGYEKENEEGGRAKELLEEVFKTKTDEGVEEKKEEEGKEGVNPINFDTFLEKFDKVREFLREVKEQKEENKREKEEEEKNKTEGEDESIEPLDEPSADVEDEEKHDEIEEDKPPYDEPTRELIAKADEARKEYEDIAAKVADLEAGIRDSEQFLTFEYGPDQAWAPLKGECAELETGQYVYKLCLFDRTVQKERHGHSEISLGHWGKWAGPKEDSNNKFTAQRYEHGQTCWNGPERSTVVQFECGEQLQLVDASEPSKCEYLFAAKSPAACVDPEELRKAAEHEEL